MDHRPDVPESVLFDILVLLPVVSLLRFKTVCKSWCSIIESSSFIREQLNHSRGKNNLIVQNLIDQVFILSGRKHELCVNLNLEGIDPNFQIVGSCNGIICLGYKYSYRHWRFSLWNPATKQVRKLPELSYFSPRETMISHGFALMFDTKADDYKIVSVSLDENGRTLNDSLLQVYSSRADSWRTIYEGRDFPIRRVNHGTTDATCKNEMCLWTRRASTGNSMVIFYFDLAKEAYGTIPLPDDRKRVPDYTLTFAKDKVTYMEWNYVTKYYEIWRMDEFGMKESWNKSWVIVDPIFPYGVTDLLHLSKDEDFFLFSKAGEDVYELYAWYFATAEVRKFDVLDACNFKNYIESMVPVTSSIETS